MEDGRPDRWFPISWKKLPELPRWRWVRRRALSIIHLMTSRARLLIPLIPLMAPFCHGAGTGKLAVRVTWGYTRPASSSYWVKVTADRGMSIGSMAGYQ